jgi:hypothetical protein
MKGASTELKEVGDDEDDATRCSGGLAHPEKREIENVITPFH